MRLKCLGLSLAAIFLLSFRQDEPRRIKQYTFGSLQLTTDTCNNGALVKVKTNGRVLHTSCFQDVVFIGGLDTLDINSDSKLDFIFTLQSDDYSTLTLLLSDKQSFAYSSHDLGDISSAELYSDYELKETEVLRDFILINRGRNAYVLTNAITDGNTLRSIINFTDTVSLNRFR
jgi:hypothetical protein